MKAVDSLGYVVPLVLAASAAVMPPALLFIPYIIIAAIFILARWDARIPLGYGCFAWFLSGAVLIIDANLANTIAVSGYWLLAAGTMILLAGLLAMPKKDGGLQSTPRSKP